MDLRTEIIDRLLKQVEDYHFSIRTIIMKEKDIDDKKVVKKLNYFTARIREVHDEIDKKLYPREFSKIEHVDESEWGTGEGKDNHKGSEDA